MDITRNASHADQVDAFLAVLETGSFTAAGRRLARDASVVSRRVAALEARLGIRLLERSTRRVGPTEAGARFRDGARQALDLMRAAEEEARDLASEPSGLLRLALPPAFGRLWIGPRLPSFLARYPALRVEACYADRYVDIVADGFDVALRIGEMKDSRLLGKRIALTRRMICASPAYLAGHADISEPEDLRRHACLGFTPMFTHPVWHLRRGRQRQAIRVGGPLESDDVQSLVEAAVAGTGIMMAADWLIAREIADGRLVQVLPQWEAEGEGGVYLVRASSELAPAKTRAFYDWMEESFAVAPWLVGRLAGS